MSGHEWYRNRVVIPYSLYDGTVVSLRFRCGSDHDCKEAGHPKYLTEGGDITHLYNSPALFEPGDEIHLCEGEFDAMILSQCGRLAVASPGSQVTPAHHLRLLAGFSRIYVWGDGDDAGREFAARVRKTHRRATAVRLPQGEDVTSVYVKQGVEGLLDLIA